MTVAAVDTDELADTLRAIVAALATSTPRDVRLAAALTAAAGIVEQRTGTG
jgi:hypothetical protein